MPGYSMNLIYVPNLCWNFLMDLGNDPHAAPRPKHIASKASVSERTNGPWPWARPDAGKDGLVIGPMGHGQLYLTANHLDSACSSPHCCCSVFTMAREKKLNMSMKPFLHMSPP